MSNDNAKSQKNSETQVDDSPLPLEIALKRRCSEQENEIATLRDRNFKLTERVSELRKQAVSLAMFEENHADQTALIEYLRKSESQLKIEMAETSFKFEEQAKHLDQSIAEIAHLKTQIFALQSDRQDEISTRTEHFEKLISQRDQMIELMQKTVEEHAAEIQALTTKYTGFRETLTEKDRAISKLQIALEDEKASYDEAYEEANTKFTELADSNWRKDAEISELKKTLALTESRLQKAMQDVNTAAHDANSTSREAAMQVAGLRTELAQKQAALEKVQQQYSYELKLRDAQSHVAVESAALNEVKFEFQKELERVKADRVSLEAQLAQAQTEIFSLKSASMHHQSELQQARFEGDRAVHQTRTTLAEEFSAKLSTEREIFDKKIRDRETEFSAQASKDNERQAQAEKRVRAELERTEGRFRNVESQLRKDLLKAQMDGSSTNAQLTVCREQIATLRAEREIFDRDLKKANETVAQLRETLFTRQAELQALSEQSANERRDLEHEFSLKLSQAEKRTHDSSGALENKVEKLNEELRIRTGEVANLERALENADRAAADSEQAHKFTIEAWVSKLEAKDEVIAGLEEKCVKLASAGSSREKHFESEIEKTEERLNQVHLHEKRLRIYASSMNSEKSKLQQMGQNLLAEIQLLSSTHPLKDYLSATEFEISKVELTLKATPMISPERSKLEDGLAKLFEQRDFLRSVLQGSKAHFDRQIQQIEQLLSSGATPVPPPAPFVIPPISASTAASAKTVQPSAAASSASAVIAVPLAAATAVVIAPAETSAESETKSAEAPVHWEKPFDQLL